MRKLAGMALILGVGCQAAQEERRALPAAVQPSTDSELISEPLAPDPEAEEPTTTTAEVVEAVEPEPAEEVVAPVSPRTPPTTAAAPITYSPPTNLASLRECESGGDYTADTGNGYYGAYQFDRQTWAAAGGSGNPAHASPAEQDARAQAWINAGYRSAWPNC